MLKQTKYFDNFNELSGKTNFTLKELKKIIEVLNCFDEKGDLHEKSRQLKAVNDSILNLGKQNISVPDDLRSLKLNLSNEIDVYDEVNNIKSKIINELKQILLLLSTKVVKRKPKKVQIKHGSSSKKQCSIQVYDLIKATTLQAGAKIEHVNKKDGVIYSGVIKNKGEIETNFAGKRELYKSLSAAAHGLTGTSLNGWIWWSVVYDDGRRVPLVKLRNKLEESMS